MLKEEIQKQTQQSIKTVFKTILGIVFIILGIVLLVDSFPDDKQNGQLAILSIGFGLYFVFPSIGKSHISF